MTSPKVSAVWLGRRSYQETYLIQKRKWEEKKNAKDQSQSQSQSQSTILFVEHESVYTLGKRGEEKDILLSIEELKSAGIEVVRTDRGGQVTFHGPGQLVCYPILDIKEHNLTVSSYVRLLESTIREVLTSYQIESVCVKKNPGIYTKKLEFLGEEVDTDNLFEVVEKLEKIAAIGVRLSRGVTMHGFSFNVSVDTNHFADIIPCGMPSLKSTSLVRKIDELSKKPASDKVNLDLKQVAKRFVLTLSDKLNCDIKFECI